MQAPGDAGLAVNLPGAEDVGVTTGEAGGNFLPELSQSLQKYSESFGSYMIG